MVERVMWCKDRQTYINYSTSNSISCPSLDINYHPYLQSTSDKKSTSNLNYSSYCFHLSPLISSANFNIQTDYHNLLTRSTGSIHGEFPNENSTSSEFSDFLLLNLNNSISNNNFDLSLSSSCPCVPLSLNCKSINNVHTSPPVPPKRAESFHCVSNHIKRRARRAELAYVRLLREKLVKITMNMTDSTSHGNNLTQQSGSNDEDITKSVPPPTDSDNSNNNNEELITPTFTPPSPLSLEINNHPLEMKEIPSFNYALDPPSSDTDYESHTYSTSEYDSYSNSHFHSQSSNESHESSKKESMKIIDLSPAKNNLNMKTTIELLTPVDSEVSSTLSATLLLTQDSDISPLPPHATRVSPMCTDTSVSTTSAMELCVTDPTATYTCTSPAFSTYSDVIQRPLDLSTMSADHFVPSKSEDRSQGSFLSTESLDLMEGLTPDTVCISPFNFEDKNVATTSKTSDEHSQQTLSLSDSQKKSQDGVSDPTNTSSERARRSSPCSSPDASISSLPSDTITMNAAISSIGTDTDPNESSGASAANLPRDCDSRQSQDETDPATDSAFASPSTSPTISKSRTVTPLPNIKKDPNEIKDKIKDKLVLVSSVTNNIIDSTSQCGTDVESSQFDIVDDTAESDSIYPESECDIRLALSKDDTEDYDYSQRNSSPERISIPIIADICDLETSDDSRNEKELHPKNYDTHSKLCNEISSSGNSSMSNSPAFSSDMGVSRKYMETVDDNPANVQIDNTKTNRSVHLNNWLNENQRNYDPPNLLLSSQSDSQIVVEEQRTKILIEELPNDLQPSYLGGYNSLRNFPYFGPLPTIHEVVDTPTELTSINEVRDTNIDRLNSSLMSSLVHSDSLREVSTATNEALLSPLTSNPFSPVPPPPPPRTKITPLKTPPLPPPPIDFNVINPHPIPPRPTEEAIIPPLPPLPIAPFLLESPPPIPPHAPAPVPPKRMYLLIPLTPRGPTPIRTSSPPPAPPRSTSLRRSPPPPLTPKLPMSPMEYISAVDSRDVTLENSHLDTDDDETRSMSSPSDVSSVICVSKLTPVPEEKYEYISSPTPQPTLLLASSENLNLLSKSSEISEKLTNKLEYSNKISTMLISLSYEPPQSDCTSSLSISSPPPPPPPPRSRISLTPPLPPPPLAPKNPLLTEKFLTNNKNYIYQQQTMKSGQKAPAPPPPPPSVISVRGRQCPSQLPTTQGGSTTSLVESSSSTKISSLMSVSSYGKLVVDRSDLGLPPPDEEIGRVFSSGIRWGWLKDGVDTVALYTQLRPIIQHGPQCGLVALSMASQLCGSSASNSRRPSTTPMIPPVSSPTTPSGSTSSASGISAAELLDAAQKEGFSTHGEMFSTESLASLANQKLGGCIEAVVRRDVLKDKYLFLELMLSGAMLLVPYDAQQNHQPGRFRGHKAHWGVVTGAIIQSNQFTNGQTSAAAFARPDPRIDNLWHVRRGYLAISTNSRSNSRASSRSGRGEGGSSLRERSSSPSKYGSGDRVARSLTPNRGGTNPQPLNEAALAAFKQINTADLHVIVVWRQGKSRLLTSSTLEDLCASNSQLREYPPALSDGGFENDYVIGNVEEGLADQVVVLTKTSQPITALSELLDRLQC